MVDDSLTILPLILEQTENGFITAAAAQKIASQSSLTPAAVETLALEHSILPLRYKRNGLSPAEQLKLLRSSVAIIGCGGLGGRNAEILGRTGVGRLILTDPDVFSETNLNRQIFCTRENLGQAKVTVLGEALQQINPALDISLHQHPFDISSITGADIVIDALDSADARKELATLCRTMDLPLVHGAVKGWYGQLGVDSCSNNIISTLYRQGGEGTTPPRVLPVTVGLIAALQAAEACKLILGRGPVRDNGWLQCDLYNGDFEAIEQE